MLLLGLLLRLWYLYDNRPLFLDEANLALNVAELSYAECFAPLQYQQYAPPLYMVVLKTSVLLLGSYEWALRLPAFLASVLSLWLFYRILYHWLHQRYILLYPLALMACSPFLLRYATEVKQYSGDVLIALSLVYLTVRWPASRLRRWQYIAWGTLGAVCVWCSMPAVFVLSGIGFYYLSPIIKSRSHADLWPWLLIGGVWLASFVGLYGAVLHTNLSHEGLQAYHEGYFFSFSGDRAWLLRGLLAPVAGYTALGLGLASLLILLGGISLVRRKLRLLWLVGWPVFVGIGASVAGYFTLMPRVCLYMMPLLLLLLAFGAQIIVVRLPAWGKFVLALLAIVAHAPIFQSILTLGQPTVFDSTREAIAWATQYDAPTFIHHDAYPAYRYYSEVHPNASSYRLQAIPVTWDQSIEQALATHQPENFVLLHGHLLSDASRIQVEQWHAAGRARAELRGSWEGVGSVGGYFW